MFKKSIVILLGIFVFASCAKQNSADVDQQSIFTIYELMYDEEDDATTARATFRFGGELGTLLQLSNPAYTGFDGEDLVYNAWFGYHELEFDGLVQNGEFEYWDRDENFYTNFVEMVDSIGFNDVDDTIFKSADHNYIWTGEPVGENETVAMSITAGTESESFTTIYEGDTSVVLTSTKLDNFSDGLATFELTRTFNTSDLSQGTNKGGRISIKYIVRKEIHLAP